MNKFGISILALVFLAGCAFTQASLPELTIKDHNRNVDYPLDQKFRVVLPSNQSTGYKWELEDITASALEKISDEYRVTDEYADNIVGAGGEEIWVFKVTEVKRSHIVLKYRKPWDKIDTVNEFLVTINGNPGDDGLLTFSGKIESGPAESQFNDCFVAEDGSKFGIIPYTRDQIEDPGIKAKIAEFTGQATQIEVRGKLIDPAVDCNGKQLVVQEIQAK